MVCDENKDSLCSGQVYDEVTWWRRTRTSICETLTTTTLPWGECDTTCRVWQVSTFVIQDSTVQCSGIQDTVIGVIWKLAEVRPWVRKPSFTTPTPGSTQWVSETLLTNDHTSSFRIRRSTRSTHASLWPWTGRRPTPRDSSAPSLTRARGHSTWG